MRPYAPVSAAAFMLACFTLTAVSDENAASVLAHGGCSFDALGNLEERAVSCPQQPGLLLVRPTRTFARTSKVLAKYWQHAFETTVQSRDVIVLCMLCPPGLGKLGRQKGILTY